MDRTKLLVLCAGCWLAAAQAVGDPGAVEPLLEPGATTTQIAQAYPYWGKQKNRTQGNSQSGGLKNNPQQGPAARPFTIRYQAVIQRSRSKKTAGTVRAQPNQSYQVVSMPGPCGQAHLGQCRVDRNGRVAAFLRDSCDRQGGQLGAAVATGCSRASYGQNSLSCCR